MKQSEFVHLHSHTMYSLLDGACKIEALAQRASEWGMPSVAMTDHGNLFGTIDFYRAMREVGINPIIGCEVYCAIENRFNRAPARGIQNGANHLVLLAKDQKGYKNLMKLVSAGYLEGFYYNPRIDKDLLKEHSEGLICLSACLSGEVAHLIDREGLPAAKEAVKGYLEIFGDNFYLEIQRHGIDREAKINDGLIRIHQEMGVQLVATNDSHFLKAEDHEAHSLLVAVQTGKTIDDPTRMCYPTGVYFKSAEEMYNLFSDLPQALETTLEISEKCNLELSFDDSYAPDFPLPVGFENAGDYLSDLAWSGMERRCNVTPEYEERLKFELETIGQTGYPGYFLILYDLVNFSQENGIRASARGSAVSSLVAYALNITAVDPIEYGLYFERFLNPERISPPDIDLDIADRDRERLIDYVVKKYGRDNVCQIITFGTMGAKGVIRDVGRALEIPFGEVDRISKLVPTELKITLDKALKMSPELEQISKDGRMGERLISNAIQLEGLARHASIHAAAVVIAPRPLKELLPLYKTPKGGEVVTQYQWQQVEDLGFLKMDFLGLRNLRVLDDTVKMVERNYGTVIDFDTLVLNDTETYELFGRGDTTGVFQFESSPMRDYLRKLKPDRIEDIIAMNALYRPGPMKYIPNYIARKHGKEEVTYSHPVVKPSLEETYGIITYQEQVMRICRDMAGFSLGEADGIRKAMGKKLATVMEKYRANFIEGSKRNGVEENIAQKVWADIEDFSGYGFNKAHSSGYSIVAYQCAYLKAHFPSEYMAANLNSEIGDIDRLVVLIDECRRMGLEVLTPDITESGIDFLASEGRIRMGMAAVRNVGRGAAEAIVKVRKEGNPFRTLFDFCEKINLRSVNKRALESLICAGALDGLDGNRAQLLAGLELAMDLAQSIQTDRQRGQISMFENEAMQVQAAMIRDKMLPRVNEWTEGERLAKEKEMLGFYLTGHPLEKYWVDLVAMGIRPVQDMERVSDGSEVKLGGLLVEVKPHSDKKGRSMAFGILEDLEGTMDLVVFPDVFQKVREEMIVDAMVVIQGRRSERNGRISVQVEKILPIEKVSEVLADAVNVLLCFEDLTGKRFESLRNLCEKFRGGCSLYLHLALETKRTVVLSKRLMVAPSEELKMEISKLTEGRARVWMSSGNGKVRRVITQAIKSENGVKPKVPTGDVELFPTLISV